MPCNETKKTQHLKLHSISFIQHLDQSSCRRQHCPCKWRCVENLCCDVVGYLRSDHHSSECSQNKSGCLFPNVHMLAERRRPTQLYSAGRSRLRVRGTRCAARDCNSAATQLIPPHRGEGTIPKCIGGFFHSVLPGSLAPQPAGALKVGFAGFVHRRLSLLLVVHNQFRDGVCDMRTTLCGRFLVSHDWLCQHCSSSVAGLSRMCREGF